MYKNNKFSSRQRGFSGQRSFRTKTFDPRHVIGNTHQLEEEVYEAKNTFADFAISQELKNNIARRGYSVPTPVQDQAIPKILEGNDVVGIANTGTGKTAAFLIPLLDMAIKNPRARILIITPTRELASQIDDELYQLTESLRIYSAVCIGGMSMGGQINALRRRPQFVMGTPGRLLDLARQRKINFFEFGAVVLDEVDRMLEMGFIRDIEDIIDCLPPKRQSLFFSATLPDSVVRTMRQFTNNPITISVKSHDMLTNVHQDVVKIQGHMKYRMLQDMLYKEEFKKVLVFGRTKRGAETLFRNLASDGFRVAAIHGNKNQNQRRKSLDLFKAGHVDILIATDVVARGIDVDDITHVINYELPETYENYLHRIGRTGRAGKKGIALTFVE